MIQKQDVTIYLTCFVNLCYNMFFMKLILIFLVTQTTVLQSINGNRQIAHLTKKLMRPMTTNVYRNSVTSQQVVGHTPELKIHLVLLGLPAHMVCKQHTGESTLFQSLRNTTENFWVVIRLAKGSHTGKGTFDTVLFTGDMTHMHATCRRTDRSETETTTVFHNLRSSNWLA